MSEHMIQHEFEPSEFWAGGWKMVLDHSQCGVYCDGKPCRQPKEKHVKKTEPVEQLTESAT